MPKLRSLFGYAWAAAALPVVLATFMGLPTWSKGLVSATGLKVSPRWTGGEVSRTVDHGAYHTSIHRPVFEGLLCEPSTGFVQVEWGPADRLPEKIDEEIDLDGDGHPAFRIRLDPPAATATLEPCDGRIEGLEGVYRLQRGLAVRVAMRKVGSRRSGPIGTLRSTCIYRVAFDRHITTQTVNAARNRDRLERRRHLRAGQADMDRRRHPPVVRLDLQFRDLGETRWPRASS